MSKIEYIIVGAVILLGFSGLGVRAYVNHQDQLKEQAIAAQQAQERQTAAQEAQIAQQAQVQATQAAQLQVKKAAYQAALDKCISNANDQANQALAESATIATTPEASATTDLAITQSLQTFIAECQAKFTVPN